MRELNNWLVVQSVRVRTNCSIYSIASRSMFTFFLPFYVSVLSPTELIAQMSLYAQAIDTNTASLAPHMDPWGLDESETMGKITPHVIFHHINHHGCVMLLHSLTARTNMEARARVIGAARTLAEFVPRIRGKRGLKRVHGSLLLMVRPFP